MWRITAYDRDGRPVTSMEVHGGEVTIGRDADRQLVLPSASVSRRHAKLVLNGPQPFIQDEGSANGVIVNGVRIQTPTAIIPGVRVDIAEFRLEFEDPTAAAAAYNGPGGGNPSTEFVRPISDQPPPGYGADVVRLVAEGGPFDGKIYDVPMTEASVGRAVENDIVLDDPSLSRRHAKIRRAGPGRIEVEDLGSSNGTYVNGRKVGKGTAGPGDAVRFGDLVFRMPGERDSTRGTQAGGSGAMVAIIAVVAAVVVLGGGAVAFLLLKKPSGPSKEDLMRRGAQAQEHVKSGKAKLADKKFDVAAAEFDQALDLDPTNADARRLKALAETEPKNQKMSQQIQAKLTMGDRIALEAALRFLGQIPDESVFHDASKRAVSQKLAQFGEGQCKTKRWADCGWAICKAYEVAPDDAKPDDEAAGALKDAEKKLARDRSYTPCRVKH